ncbi:MAG: hypothetical protein JETCAE02_19540 [Anaerolineaceae bacterium]|nr:hypothetical protein [Anaerolineae bacterium]MBL1170985.1 hypothetical protein [Chloroflexota bacterium]MDL1924985.1 hypothetical protein [Anaerolineae bacterium AMX1]WKZ52959.1 MAG: M14 family metallopeptidase [Anaerolineales bacterium]GJQ39542.1 MAG: hypothetical protein JETCAE02_19540 [Anaerolineaceae bacterium]
MSRAARLVALLWGINILALLVVLGVVVFYAGRQPARAAFASTPTEPVIYAHRIYVIPPTFSYPTLTTLNLLTPPDPPATPIPPVTPTPLFLTSGRRSAVIGLSARGRPIEVYTFGDGETQRMIVAGIHGGYEWNTIALADELITHFDANPQDIPENVTLYILRSLNPDGDARGHDKFGRANERGVDLNRNFPVNWQEDWDRDGCWKDLPLTGGDFPASEPETRALIRFIEQHHVDALISYHSAALGVFPGGDPWDADSIRLAKALAKITGYPFPPLDTGCIYQGTLADYAVSMGAAAVDMELNNHRDTDFESNLQALLMFLNWTR